MVILVTFKNFFQDFRDIIYLFGVKQLSSIALMNKTAIRTFLIFIKEKNMKNKVLRRLIC